MALYCYSFHTLPTLGIATSKFKAEGGDAYVPLGTHVREPAARNKAKFQLRGTFWCASLSLWTGLIGRQSVKTASRTEGILQTVQKELKF